MRYILYTDRTVAQCLSALNERMEAKATSTRPAMDGWIEKGGKFSLAVSTKVAGRFSRTTRLSGSLERESGITTIRIDVPGGANDRGQRLSLLAMLVVSALTLLTGELMLGLLLALLGGGFYVLLRGDHQNSEILLRELRSILRAKETPPKKEAPSAKKPDSIKKPGLTAQKTVSVKKTATPSKPPAKPASSKSTSPRR